jgi:molybdopterin-guanine dinucleotide biosynthesis protein A
MPVIARRLAEHEFKMTALFSDVSVREVSTAELAGVGDAEWLLTNVNTPAELADLVALEGHKL